MGNLGVLVNNAGVMAKRNFFTQDPEEIQIQHKLNMYAITLLSKAARNAFKSQYEKA